MQHIYRLGAFFLMLGLTPLYAGDVEDRIARFKQSGADIQAIFKVHLPAKDFDAIGAAANKMAMWGQDMTRYFPAGSTSEGAKAEIWQDFADFTAKAAAFSQASQELVATAAGGDAGRIAHAAKAVGATCKACHQSYRNKK